MPMDRIWRRLPSSPWRISREWWSARPAGRSAGSTCPRSPGSTFEARRCCSTPAGTSTGERIATSKAIPFLTAAGAEWLARQGAALVGIDSLNIDDTADPRRSAHSTLLRASIPIVEHLCHLDRVPDAGFRFFAVPVKVRAFGTFPVRAFAVI